MTTNLKLMQEFEAYKGQFPGSFFVRNHAFFKSSDKYKKLRIAKCIIRLGIVESTSTLSTNKQGLRTPSFTTL